MKAMKGHENTVPTGPSSHPLAFCTRRPLPKYCTGSIRTSSYWWYLTTTQGCKELGPCNVIQWNLKLCTVFFMGNGF